MKTKLLIGTVAAVSMIAAGGGTESGKPSPLQPPPPPSVTAHYAPPPQHLVAPAGTTILVRLNESVSTKRNRPGDRFDGILEAVPFDKSHGVEGSTVAVRSETVHRDDSWMFESAGDLGFEHEPGAAGWVVGVLLENLLERHLAMQLLIEGDEHSA